MSLNNLKPAAGSVKKAAKIIGRGQGSGKGGTATRGHKGAKSRSGYSKKIGFERVLFALGIRYVGATVAKKLARAFGDIDSLKNASLEDLVAVDEIGERIAQSVIDYFDDDKNVEMVERLQSAGLQFELSEDQLPTSDLLAGKSIVVSGVFNKVSRKELKDLIEKHGGKSVGSVSAKTSYLVAGENMGPSKLEKAEKLEVDIINEDEFLNLIGKA